MKSFIVALCMMGAVGMAGMVGCDREGPAEKAGEKIDQGAEKATESMETAGEKTKDAVN